MRTTLNSVCFWYFFEMKNKKNIFTFDSKTLSFRKYFPNENIFVLKKFIFVLETLSLLVAN